MDFSYLQKGSSYRNFFPLFLFSGHQTTAWSVLKIWARVKKRCPYTFPCIVRFNLSFCRLTYRDSEPLPWQAQFGCTRQKTRNFARNFFISRLASQIARFLMQIAKRIFARNFFISRLQVCLLPGPIARFLTQIATRNFARNFLPSWLLKLHGFLRRFPHGFLHGTSCLSGFSNCTVLNADHHTDFYTELLAFLDSQIARFLTQFSTRIFARNFFFLTSKMLARWSNHFYELVALGHEILKTDTRQR